MPHLRKQPFHKVRPPAELKPDEEVFHCKITNEIFRDYEAFFERIILCNSLVWSCSITGRSGMTFQEAEECEEKARRHLATFQDSLQRPMLFLASLTHRGRLADLNDDVFLFAKDRYFIGETVEVLIGGERRPSKIVKVMAPPNPSSKSNGDVIVIDEDSESENDDKRELPAADSMLYIVLPSTGKNNRVMVKANQISRKKGLYTRDKSKLFLKQHCEPVNGVWSVKESVMRKMKLTESKYEDFYGGPRPRFSASVIKKKASKKSAESTPSTSSTGESHTSSTTTSTPKNSGATKSSTPSMGSKSTSPSDSSASPHPVLTAAERAARKEQERQEKMAERMAKQQEIRQKIEEEKQRRKEEREKEREKKKEEKKKQMEKLKEWSRPREDLECDDLKPFPEMRELRSLVPTHMFGDAVMVLEYVNAFKTVFDFKQFFPKGFTWKDLEEGLMQKDPQGPLCDLLQMLLCALFNLQEEEAEEYQALEREETDHLDSKKPAPGEDDQTEEDDQLSNNELIRSATVYAQSSQLTFGMPLKDTLLDQFTLTEVLRLHLMSSGARANSKNARFRYQQRGGYSSLDDPGLELRRQDPALLKKLQTGNVFDFSPDDKLRVVTTLVQQVMTYAAVRDMVEETYDKLRVKKYDLKLLQWAEVRRIKEEQALQYKRQMEEKTKEREYRLKELARAEQIKQAKEQGLPEPDLPLLEDPPESAEHRQQREDKERQEENKRRADYARRELEVLQSIVDLQRTNALYPMGRDRHYRRYWLFSSLPALLVEDNELFLFSSSSSTAPSIGQDQEMPHLTPQEDHDMPHLTPQEALDDRPDELDDGSVERDDKENTNVLRGEDLHNTSSDKENDLNRAVSGGALVTSSAKNGEVTGASVIEESMCKERLQDINCKKVSTADDENTTPEQKQVAKDASSNCNNVSVTDHGSSAAAQKQTGKDDSAKTAVGNSDSSVSEKVKQEAKDIATVSQSAQQERAAPSNQDCNDADSETGESRRAAGGDSLVTRVKDELQPMDTTESRSVSPSPSADLELPRLDSSPLEHLLRQQQPRWYVVHSHDCLEELLTSLNMRGFRESALHAALSDYKPFLKLTIDSCPVRVLCRLPDGQRDAEHHDGGKEGAASSSSSSGKPMQTRGSGPPVVALVDGATQSDSAAEAIELTLRDGLLDIEDRIFNGSLGGLKVRDRAAWRSALEHGAYDPQTDEAPFALIQSPKKNRPREGDEVKEVLVPEEQVARDLCHALVQIARGVEPRFIKSPLGESTEDKKKSLKDDKHEGSSSTDKDKNGERETRRSRLTTLERWEDALLTSSNLSQVFLHLAALDKSITWDRSALMARCRICRRKADPEKMLLCDKCDRGHHMYCLTPPMTKVPSGDWYCPNCRPKQPPPSPRKNRRRTFSEVEEEEEAEEALQLQETIVEEGSEEEEDMDQQESDGEEGREEEAEEEEDDDDSDDEDNEDVCAVCREDGRLILCDVCPRSYHMHCARPMLRKVPKGKWMCQVCVEGGRAGKIQLGRPPKASASRIRDVTKKEMPKSSGGSTGFKSVGGKSGSRSGSRKETPRSSPTPTPPTSRARQRHEGPDKEVKGSAGHKGREVTARQKAVHQDKDWTPKGGDRVTPRGGSKVTPKGGDKVTPKGGNKITPKGSDKVTPKGGNKVTPKGGEKVIPKGGDKVTPKGGDKVTPRGGDKATSGLIKSKRGSTSRLSTDGEFEISARQYTSSKRGNSQVQQMHAAEELLQELIKHADAWPFLSPVDKKLVPDYYTVISQPMDLCTIRNRVHAFHYSLPSQLLADVRLIFHNCIEYNARNTPEYRAGQALNKFFDSRVRDLGLGVDSCSPSSSEPHTITSPPVKKQRR